MKKWKSKKCSAGTVDLAVSTDYETQIRVDEESRRWVRTYLVNFLQNCDWNDQLDNISIAWESVPSMQDLESYGMMNESEGTRACRKLFKAAVIWDDLGHALWKTLRAAYEEQQESSSGASSPAPSRGNDTSYSSARASIDSSNSRYNFSSSAQSEAAAYSYTNTTSRAYPPDSFSSRTQSVSSTGSGSSEPATRQRSNSRSLAMSRTFAHSCNTAASAVKRAFGDKSSSHVTRRAIQ